MTQENNDGVKPLITVVDDMIGNLKIVGKILLSAGYEVAMTQDSKKAIEILENNPPELILLDIMMPFVNGYEICEQLKQNEKLKEIPVIFFTAKNETSDLVKGFEVGGVDYIVKPANKEELLARVRTHIELKRTKDLLTKQKNEIESLFKEKNQFFDIAIKNVKQPLEKVADKAQYIKKMKAQITNKEFEDHLDWIIQDARNSFQTISDLYDVNYLDFKTELTENDLTTFSIDELIRDILTDYDYDIKRKRLIVKVNEHEEEDVLGLNLDEKVITSDKASVRQILDNLISNAVKYSPFYKSIQIVTGNEFAASEQILKFIIKDEGPGIGLEDQKYLFNKFVKIDTPTSGKEPSSGLGMYIVRRLVDRIKGKVSVKSVKDQGAAFIVLFPKFLNLNS